MVEVFKTDVTDRKVAQQLLAALGQRLPGYKINFDLDDCDRILRVENECVNGHEIMALIQANGFQCMVLE